MTHTASTASPFTAKTTPATTTILRKGLPLLTMATLMLVGGCGHTESLSTHPSDTNRTTTRNTTEAPAQPAADTSISTVSLVAQNEVVTQNEERVALTPEPKQTSAREYGLRPLTEDELTEYQDHTYSLLSEHSFHLTYSDINEANFIAAATTVNGLRNLHLYVSAQGGDFYTLPAHHEGHYMTDLKAVSFKQLNELNDSPDIIVIAEYITGVGPTGTVPFPVTTVYHYQGNGQYSKDEALSERLTQSRVETIADAMAQINSPD